MLLMCGLSVECVKLDPNFNSNNWHWEKHYFLVAEPTKIEISNIKKGDWVKVLYEGEWFLGKMVKIIGKSFLVCCLKKHDRVKETQDFRTWKGHSSVWHYYSTDGVTPH